MTSLDGRVALVTGAARGLGLGIARELASAGALVYCADLTSADSAAAELQQIQGSPGGLSVRLDILDRSAVAATLDGILETEGRLDIVVNNAGVGQQFAPLHELDQGSIEHVVNVNLIGTLNCCAEAATRIADSTGRIINIASHYGLVGRANYAPYCASKAGVIALTQALALELAARRITVNSICPGTMLTDMVRDAYEQRAIVAGLGAVGGPELLASFTSDTIPLGRTGSPSDVGRMAAWIASDAASFTTGAAFNLSGGETLY
ncbi:SDR family NAD(P)-dependent oxidoreductase [Streptomyces chartreusis]|uniref:SDR family NAD(P)-dependent oxidoreductase n=1 Tax=Streptomyces chartreusis TaxID=1969 RepID=UPI002F90A533|nr:SDR family oxidoreductase [Streptomyces chartreusis]WTA33462.1 SDR family oxidoreductase [Streptomyces chartreusis]